MNEVVMLNIQSKKMTLPLTFCLVLALLVPALAQAELGGSGSSAARDAAEQKAAKERKLEKKRLKEAEAKKAAETQVEQPAETQTPAVEPKAEPAAQ
jgi:hypothetical protein